ncbi:phage holin family protein [Candidatus Berkelbacteria bacterium]|nr:phage holin family protein [Candidatus Berkelbacteria bacterium]
MMIIFRWLILAGIMLLISNYLPGFRVDSFYSALIAVLIIGLLNLLVKPILIVLTLPITILTLGLFAFVINAIVIYIASSIVKGFYVDSFLAALIASILLSIAGIILNKFFDQNKNTAKQID